MRPKSFILFLLLLGALGAACQSEILTNKTVVDLCRAGLDSTLVVSKIEASNCKFDLSSTGLHSWT